MRVPRNVIVAIKIGGKNLIITDDEFKKNGKCIEFQFQRAVQQLAILKQNNVS